jgi:hypothetical protein
MLLIGVWWGSYWSSGTLGRIANFSPAWPVWPVYLLASWIGVEMHAALARFEQDYGR